MLPEIIYCGGRNRRLKLEYNPEYSVILYCIVIRRKFIVAYTCFVDLFDFFKIICRVIIILIMSDRTGGQDMKNLLVFSCELQSTVACAVLRA